ncbi:MAG: iron chelate uptake ABC transporter family permease subunit [Rhodobacteraceae bacterium]|nr:iron chelate uptake ABC transporter family permease subunit [Paracoccaceae bacterium]
MPDRKLLLLGACAVLAILAYLTLGARGNWGFVLSFRGTKLAALVLVAAAVALSTVLFQTLTSNRILTPSIMGFDALYLLVQTGLVFALGSFGYAALAPETKFAFEVILLTAAALALFGTLLGNGLQDLFRVLLIGVIFGVLFRSLTSLLQRMIDPNAFAVVQGAMFASFNRVDKELLVISAGLILLCCFLVWRKRHVLDVMALGREQAISLGLNHRRELFIGLVLVTVLVATSTALVGPVAFFGLLVSALTYELMKTHHHGSLLIASVLLAVIVLVGGQTLFERVLGLGGSLSIVIEFLGGLVFLFLILRKVRA